MLSRNLKVTLIEDNIAWADKETNMAQLRRNMQNMPDDTDLVILPELFSTGFIVDDRDVRAGSMFADWELIGVPHRVVIGDRGLKTGEVEYVNRASMADKHMIKTEEIAAFLCEKLGK